MKFNTPSPIPSGIGTTGLSFMSTIEILVNVRYVLEPNSLLARPRIFFISLMSKKLKLKTMTVESSMEDTPPVNVYVLLSVAVALSWRVICETFSEEASTVSLKVR